MVEMSNGNVEITNPYILDAIRYYKFGALIEVTNGLHDMSKRQEKKRQVKRGKEFLMKAVGDSAQIQGGLALIKTNVPEIKELDFYLQMEDYDPRLLDTVVSNLLETGQIEGSDRKVLEDLIERSRRTGMPFHHLLNPTRQVYRSMPAPLRRTYNDNLCAIKGTVLERYVAQMIGREMDFDHAMVLGARMKDTDASQGRTADTDILIAASATNFRSALERIAEKYSQRDRRITVTFNS
jgi:hypothetical protein